MRAVAMLEGWLRGLALASWRHPARVLALTAVVVVAGLLGARGIRVDTDVTGMLPEDFPSSQALDELRERFGGVGFVVVVGRGGTSRQLKSFALDVAERVERLPSIDYVQHCRPAAYLGPFAGYMLPVEGLRQIRQDLEGTYAAMRRRANPMYVDLEGPGGQAETEAGPDPGVAPGRSLRMGDLLSRRAGKGKRRWLSQVLDTPFYLDRERGVVAVLAKPRHLASDLGFSEQVVREVEAAVASMDLSIYGPDFRVDYTGRFVKKRDAKARISSDLRAVSLASIGGMLLSLLLYFRGIVPLLLILVPLVAGMIPMFGLASLAFGSLNLLTAFIGAILLGLGIDHGIHLVDRFSRARAEGLGSEEAVAETFGRTGRAVLLAALTTAVGFFGLATSRFRGFSEFGLLAGAGIMTVVLGYLSLLPALIRLAERARWRAARAAGPSESTVSRRLPRWAVPILGASALLLVVAGVEATGVRFNTSFGALEGNDLPSFRLDKVVNRIVGHSQTPLVVLTDRSEDERAVVRALRDRKEALGQDSRVDFVASAGDLVPEDQEARWAELRRIHKVLRKIRPSWLGPADRKERRRALRMTAQPPFGREDLPEQVRRRFAGRDGKGGIVLVFSGIDLSESGQVLDLAEEVRDIRIPGGRSFQAAGEAMVAADVLGILIDEGPSVILLTLLLIFLTQWLLLGRLGLALLALVPAVTTFVGVAGLMALSDLELNFVNVMLIPMIFGISVDGGVHIATGTASSGLSRSLVESARPIAGSLLTSGVGFGSLLLADHPGLRSMGAVAALGVAVNILSCLVLFPALLRVIERGRCTGLFGVSRKEPCRTSG